MATMEAVPLYPLRSFYAQERDHHGTYMGEGENTENATARRLSCRTDFELLALRDAALEFARRCEQAYQERFIADDDSCVASPEAWAAEGNVEQADRAARRRVR